MPLPIALLTGLVSAVPAAYKTFQGMRQISQAKRGLRNLERPEYEIPKEVLESTNIARMRYADKFMPGQGMLMDRIEQQAANAYAQSTEAGNPFALISNIQAQSANQLANVQTQAMQQQMANEQQYRQALQQLAGYREKEFQLNEFAPYSQKYSEFRDIYGAGQKNLYGGLDSLAGIGTSMLGSMFMGLEGLGQSGNRQKIDDELIKAALEEYLKK